jgi:hypothetical protein
MRDSERQLQFLVGYNISSILLVGELGRIAFFSYLSEQIYHIYHSHYIILI